MVSLPVCCRWGTCADGFGDRIRDRKLLTAALDLTPPFLRNKESDQGPLSSSIFPLLLTNPSNSGTVVDYRNWQIPLGRRFRSLKLFFVLRSYGISGFQSHLRSLIALSTHLTTLISSSPLFTLFVPRRWSLVVFRLVAPGGTEEDSLNREFFRRVGERRDIHLTPTIVGGVYCTRLVVGSPFTKVEHVERAWEVVQEVAAEARAAVAV